MTQVLDNDIKVIVPREYRQADPRLPAEGLSARTGTAMFDVGILFPAVLNGLTTGAVYALVALGLTLIYGVLHIINFAHGAALMMALYGVYFLKQAFGIDPYLALLPMVAVMFAAGYALQRGIVNRASHGKDENILLVTLGLSIVLENIALLAFKSDTRTIETSYTLATVAIGPAMIAVSKLVAFAGALVTSAVLLWIVRRTDLGRAIRAVAREKQGARLVGIDVDHVYAMSFGIGLACLGAAACFLLPAYYVNPLVGNGFVLVAFTIVVLGGMGSFAGALVGGLLIGVVESLGGLWFGESLGQIGIFLLFIAVLLFRPQGLFGAKA
jgi:branched-chain amino acid transport system permease protein